jgi:hypothetical protein
MFMEREYSIGSFKRLGSFKHSMGARNPVEIGLSYWTLESILRLLKSLKIRALVKQFLQMLAGYIQVKRWVDDVHGEGVQFGSFKQSMGARNPTGIELSYRLAARLYRLAESIPRNRFLVSIKV